MTMSDPRLGMVAGEPSGDLLAQLLLGGLKQRWPALQSFGLGGPQMETQGFEAWWNYDLLAVHGYSLELLLRLRRLFALRAELGDRLLKERPDAFIGVDVPDFNLGLEARLKKAGMKTIHFVSPSIWAWRGGRIHKIREAVDHVLCLFPFEPEIYQRAGIAASYVGHPLADAIPLEVPREAARAALGLPLDARVIALLPGSRRGEVRHIAPALLGAAARLAKARRIHVLGLRSSHLVAWHFQYVMSLLDDRVRHLDGPACSIRWWRSSPASSICRCSTAARMRRWPPAT
jgi:lipid-A-disaccharide synthase